MIIKDNIDFSLFKESIRKGFEDRLSFFLKKKKNKPIHILYIGNCFQGSFLRPMLEAIKSYDQNSGTSRSIEVYTVKNNDSLELFDEIRVNTEFLLRIN